MHSTEVCFFQRKRYCSKWCLQTLDVPNFPNKKMVKVVWALECIMAEDDMEELFTDACIYVRTTSEALKSEDLLYFYARYKQV